MTLRIGFMHPRSRYFALVLAPALAFSWQDLACGQASSVSPETVAVAGGGASSSTPFQLKADDNSFELGASESVLAWARWHKKVGKALDKAIHHFAGQKLGAASITITINRNHDLSVELISSSGNPDIGTACLDAARSLDKTEVLEFPEGSQRQRVKFDIAYKRAYFIMPKHQYIKDDYEKISSEQ